MKKQRILIYWNIDLTITIKDRITKNIIISFELGKPPINMPEFNSTIKASFLELKWTKIEYFINILSNMPIKYYPEQSKIFDLKFILTLT